MSESLLKKKYQKETQERFGYQWLRYPGSLEQDESILLEETQIPSDQWNGKLVMDAGCGMGRYTLIALSKGARVVAFDLSPAITRLSAAAKKNDRLHLVQGDLMHPPFKKEVFDIVYSLGVLHHTPNTRQAFEQIHNLVRKGTGILTCWVYGKAGKWSQFKSNPLKNDRQWLKKYIFLLWLIVHLRGSLSNALRLFSVHLPHRILYLFCYPLALLGKIPLVQYLTYSVHPNWRVRLQENFDYLAPPYQFHHTKEEMQSWFKELGYNQLSHLPHGVVPKVGIKGHRKD